MFGLHLPKTAGSTFLKMCGKRLGARLFQNTSQVKNFDAGRACDVLSIADPSSVRMAFGHHLYETTLQFFRRYHASFLTMTFLREPMERLQSQFDFDARLARALSLAPPDEDEFLARNTNAVCAFYVARFPTLAGAHGSLSERALRVLAAFDCVLPHHAVRRGFALASATLDVRPTWLGFLPRSNAGTGIARLRAAPSQLRALNHEDLTLHEAFEAARRERPAADNPLSSEQERLRLAVIAERALQVSELVAQVAPSLALELVTARGVESVVRRCLQLRGLERELLEQGLASMGIALPVGVESAA